MASGFQSSQTVVSGRDGIESYLIIFNIAKDSNFGFLIRTANAFGAKVIVVGNPKFSRGGASGGTRYTKVTKFYTLTEALDFVRSKNCEVIGIEIGDDSESIWDSPYQGSVAFMVGNEGTGLTDAQLQLCDRLVHVPQYGDAVSCNVNVAGGIVLSHFARWAEFQAKSMVGRQFKEL
jgi:tRNA G18 (ribose-2'-O)-methylase SpoU